MFQSISILRPSLRIKGPRTPGRFALIMCYNLPRIRKVLTLALIVHVRYEFDQFAVVFSV